jgi:membrane protease YdiL (CAAX protease family)
MLDAYATVQLTHGHGLARIPAHVLFLVACVASASCEELVMRGYLITRFERLFRSTSAAVLVSSALFASYHLYQGIHGVIGAAITGLVYATAFCSVRRLWPVCVAHALHNYIIYLWTVNY